MILTTIMSLIPVLFSLWSLDTVLWLIAADVADVTIRPSEGGANRCADSRILILTYCTVHTHTQIYG